MMDEIERLNARGATRDWSDPSQDYQPDAIRFIAVSRRPDLVKMGCVYVSRAFVSRQILEKNGYSDKEIDVILRLIKEGRDEKLNRHP